MSKKFLAAALAILLIITTVAPAVLFVAPQRASAQFGACSALALGGIASLFGIGGAIGGAVPTFPSDQAANKGAAAATYADCFDKMVTQPMIRSMVRMVLQAITQTIVNWINNTPGTGQSSFVRNLSRHLQSVGDAVALPFINQVRAIANPQYAAAIASSLLMSYARQSSVGGFFAANQSTLGRYSPDPAAFLRGNWSQGGTSAWFGLVTRDENNPYLFNIAAKEQLATLVGQATTNRRQDLVQSKGFLSWCGTSSGGAGAAGYSPGAPCRDRDGKEGNVQTPGTVIQGYTQQLLGANIAQYIDPKDVDAALQIILQTALTAGIRGITTGLFSSSEPSSVRPTAITNAQYNAATTNLNTTNSANTAVQAKLTLVADYTTAWNTIAAAAAAARDGVDAVKNNMACSSEQRSEATAALNIGINPIIAEAQAALASVANTQTLAQEIQQDMASNPTLANTKTQTLQALPPSAAEVAAAQARAVTSNPNNAIANPAGSLTVSGGTTVDQMDRISQNAQAISANCPVSSPG